MKRILTFLLLLLAITGLASAQDQLMLTGSSATTHANYRITALYNPNTGLANLSVTQSQNSGTSSALAAFVWNQNAYGQVYNAEGDSITQTPNGAGVTSWFGIIMTGTDPNCGFFNGHGTCYDNAIGGSVISNGTATGLYTSGNPANMPQTCTVAAYSTGATTLTVTSSPLTGSLAPPPNTPGGASTMVVVGPGIPFGTSGTVNGPGTVITLSKATTSGGSGSIYLGGNNCMDRWAILDYPNSPVATGNTNACFYFVMAGANSLKCGESGTNMIQDAIALSATARAAGYIPVVSTILPCAQFNSYTNSPQNGNMWWGPWVMTSGTAYGEAAREQYNRFIKMHGIPGAIVVDSAQAFSGDPVIFNGTTYGGWPDYDASGIHPVGQSNETIASYVSSVMIHRGASYNATSDIVESAKEFSQIITLDQGIVVTSTTQNGGVSFPINGTPNLPVGNSALVWEGPNTSGSWFGSTFWGFNYTTGGGGGGGYATFGVTNAPPVVTRSANETEVDIGFATNSLPNGNNQALAMIDYNAGMGIFVENPTVYGYTIGGAAIQPGVSAGTDLNGWWTGTNLTTNQAGGWNWMPRTTTTNSALHTAFYGFLAKNIWAFVGGDTTVSGTNDDGYPLSVDGNTAVGSASTQRIVLTGTNAGTPATPGTVNTWETVIVNGTTDYIPVYH